jgi:outer membrane protein OmpA-like peptidoglycan-associated protein
MSIPTIRATSSFMCLWAATLLIALVQTALADPLLRMAEDDGTTQIVAPLDPVVVLRVSFGANSAIILPQSHRQLRELGLAMNMAPLKDRRFEISVHTDGNGDAEVNKVLSQHRADSLVAYLVTEFLVDRDRLDAVGHAEEHLRDPADPSNVINDRVEIRAQ